MVLTLVDGDGYIFRSELLKKGEEGGRDAAVRYSSIRICTVTDVVHLAAVAGVERWNSSVSG